MANLNLRKLSNFRPFAAVVIGAMLIPAIFAQAPRQLQVEVGPNQQVRILASDVTYGEVLRVLQRKLDLAIEIPSVADEMKLSYVRVEATQPQIALAKLLDGSGLGYAFVGGVIGSRTAKVIVIASTPREAPATQGAASSSPIPDNAAAGASLPLPAQAQAATAESTPELPPAQSIMPLADAINAIGVPPGVSPSDVGKMMTFPISDAAKIMGVPPGVSPSDVGKTVTMPPPTGPGKHP
jgi:hypothetical protein